MKWLGLVASFASVAVVAVAGQLLTNPGLGPWYDGLAKPAWTPPPWVFGPVWTVLYALMAVAAWLAARASARPIRTIGVHAAQLALNVAWSGLFFTLRAPWLAFAEILVLLAAIVLTIVEFAAASRTAAGLLVPYFVWVCFAAVLNVAITLAN